MRFLGRMFQGTKRFLGKVKGGLGAGLRLFDKAKAGYEGFKKTVSSLPFVGNAASDLVRRGEDYAKEKTGIDPAMISKAINIARTVESILPG